MIGAVSLDTTSRAMGSDPRLHKAAQEFEAMLLADLMKIGRQDTQAAGDSGQDCQGYEDLRNQGLATALARDGGIGIARILEHKLGPDGDIKGFSSSADISIAGIFKGDAAR